MSSLTRMLGILDLYHLGRPFLTSEEIMEATGFSRPTTFRYLKELRQSGLLARFAGGYVLGAKVIKLDYVIRQSDPVLRLFQPIMARLRDEIDCDVILASLLGDEFLATIHEQTGTTSVSWPRGRPMPLTRGAGGLAALSLLGAQPLRRLLARTGDLEGLEALKAQIRQVKKQGYALSLGALEPDNVGIAAPLPLPGLPPAALTLVMSRKRYLACDLDMIVQRLQASKAAMIRAFQTASEEADDRSRR